MANNKKSFLLYCDIIHTMDYLTVEQRGEVFTWVLEYVNDKNPKPLNGLLQAVIEPIKQQLKRDLKKYEDISERNRKNGKKGGRPSKPKKPTGLNGLNKKPKKADTDTDTDTDTDIDINIQSKIDLFNIFWSKYPNKVSKQKSQDKFLKLKQSEIDKILSTIDDFVNYKPFKEYNHPNPTTYLNQKRWEDELKPANKLKFENLKALNLTSVNHITTMCKQPKLLQDYINKYKTTTDELRQYIKFRIDNNYQTTYEI